MNQNIEKYKADIEALSRHVLDKDALLKRHAEAQEKQAEALERIAVALEKLASCVNVHHIPMDNEGMNTSAFPYFSVDQMRW